jgi:hypothetical protein
MLSQEGILTRTKALSVKSKSASLSSSRENRPDRWDQRRIGITTYL